jgi:hypothetical protein
MHDEAESAQSESFRLESQLEIAAEAFERMIIHDEELE